MTTIQFFYFYSAVKTNYRQPGVKLKRIWREEDGLIPPSVEVRLIIIYFKIGTLKIIEFLYGFLYTKYVKWGEKSIPGVYAIALISIIQVLNLVSILLILLLLKRIQISQLKNIHVIATTVLIIILNFYIIYKVKNERVILQNFNMGIYDRKVKIVSLFYVVFTVVIFLFLFIYYLNERKNLSI